MKNIFFFILASVSLYAQKTETIKLSQSVKSKKHNYKSFTVIDQRANPNIGSVTFHDDQVNVAFENEAAKDLQNWFYSDNPVRGNDELVLLLENINISEDKQEKVSIAKLKVRASTFLKKDDGYHFLSRKDTVATVSSRTTPYLAQSLAKKLTLTLSELLRNTYRAKAWDFTVSQDELSNYSALLIDKLEIYKTYTLKDGVYNDYYSFFIHSPEPGFTIETNSKGIVTKAVNGDAKKPIRNFYAFVHNGVPFKVIPVGYAEIFKDDKGILIEATKAELFPETTTSGVTIGAAAGGLVGGLIGAAIDISLSGKRKNIPGSQVYLDPLTGNYILPEDFGKSKK